MKTKLMAILNVTPDSFYSKSCTLFVDEAVKRGITLFNEGADIIDIGGESTRPYAHLVSEQEELDRVIPVVEKLSKEVPIPLSIDTMKPSVAQEALKAGATIINDVSGFRSDQMTLLAKEKNCPIVVMHMKGTPQTMQKNPYYPEGIIPHLIQWFTNKVNQLISQGIKKEQIILDPGIGFGKTVADNYKIIHNLRKLRDLGFPLLLGTSRKSFMGKILHKPANELLIATISINTLVIASGVDFIRVHDVKEHRDMIDLLWEMQLSEV